MNWYSVDLEAEGPGPTDEAIERLAGLLEGDERAAGVAVSWGGIAGGPSARFSVRVNDPAAACREAVRIFDKARKELGVSKFPVVHVDIATEEYLEASLNLAPTEYMGVTEVARFLGVSRQRVYELRTRADFPKPIADLASGPVWTRESLNHFLAGWDDWRPRGGRPKRPRPTDRPTWWLVEGTLTPPPRRRATVDQVRSLEVRAVRDLGRTVGRSTWTAEVWREEREGSIHLRLPVQAMNERDAGLSLLSMLDRRARIAGIMPERLEVQSVEPMDEIDEERRPEKRSRHVERLPRRVDPDVLDSEEMWR